jgi:hypothetical protein
VVKSEEYIRGWNEAQRQSLDFLKKTYPGASERYAEFIPPMNHPPTFRLEVVNSSRTDVLVDERVLTDKEWSVTVSCIGSIMTLPSWGTGERCTLAVFSDAKTREIVIRRVDSSQSAKEYIEAKYLRDRENG